MKHECSLSIMLPHDPVMDVLRKLKHHTRVMMLSRNAQRHHGTKSQKLVSDCQQSILIRHKMFLASLEIIWVAPKLNHVLENEDRSSAAVNIAIELDMADATAVGMLCDHG